MASITLWGQKCSGRLYNLTQTDILDTTIIWPSKSKNQGVTKSPTEAQNHGPSCNIYSKSSHIVNFTMKKPLEKNLNLTIYCPICEYPMEEIHFF